MARRSPGRYLAPLALAATVAGTYLIVHAGLTHTSSTSSSHVSSRATNNAKRGKNHQAKIYVVQPGDTLSSIAQKTRVSVATLEALNPKLVDDPNSLQAAQRLKLRR